jgi:hypothetical protein
LMLMLFAIGLLLNLVSWQWLCDRKLTRYEHP